MSLFRLLKICYGPGNEDSSKFKNNNTPYCWKILVTVTQYGNHRIAGTFNCLISMAVEETHICKTSEINFLTKNSKQKIAFYPLVFQSVIYYWQKTSSCDSQLVIDIKKTPWLWTLSEILLVFAFQFIVKIFFFDVLQMWVPSTAIQSNGDHQVKFWHILSQISDFFVCEFGRSFYCRNRIEIMKAVTK